MDLYSELPFSHLWNKYHNNKHLSVMCTLYAQSLWAFLFFKYQLFPRLWLDFGNMKFSFRWVSYWPSISEVLTFKGSSCGYLNQSSDSLPRKSTHTIVCITSQKSGSPWSPSMGPAPLGPHWIGHMGIEAVVPGKVVLGERAVRRTVRQGSSAWGAQRGSGQGGKLEMKTSLFQIKKIFL